MHLIFYVMTYHSLEIVCSFLIFWMFEIFTYISFQKNPVGSEMFNIKPLITTYQCPNSSLSRQLFQNSVPLVTLWNVDYAVIIQIPTVRNRYVINTCRFWFQGTTFNISIDQTGFILTSVRMSIHKNLLTQCVLKVFIHRE